MRVVATAYQLDKNGAYQMHTFYGAGGLDDNATSIALTPDHQIYVAGTSVATWLGDYDRSPLHAYSGNADGDRFILKLSDRVFSTFLPTMIH